MTRSTTTTVCKDREAYYLSHCSCLPALLVELIVTCATRAPAANRPPQLEAKKISLRELATKDEKARKDKGRDTKVLTTAGGAWAPQISQHRN